jgi:hypothetical protein
MRYPPRAFGLLGCLLLAGCDNNGPPPPDPVQPRLVAVSLIGQRACGPVTIGERVIAFTCEALPTTLDSGWQLTPVRVPSTANPARLRLNRQARLTFEGPSPTEIDVEFVMNSGRNAPLTRVDPNRPGSPSEVGVTKQVGVVTADNGTTRTWTLEVNVSPCASHRTLQVFNRSRNKRSGPVEVTFFRLPGDDECAEYGSGGGGGLGLAIAGKPAPGSPAKPKPSGPCPGGAAEQLFHVCENCANLHPPELNAYTGFEACSWSDVLDVFGYTGQATTKPQLCTIRQVASREACEGP